MRSTWFISQKDLDDFQKRFILLPIDGKYFLQGPPGSGKTNLLLLRAQFTASAGEKNILIITYTNALADFIRGGMTSSGLIGGDQVKTYHSWACQHISKNLGADRVPLGEGFDEKTRPAILDALLETNSKLPSKKVYSAIFVDEAQDFSADELKALLCLSDRVFICGDSNQGIYRQDGLTIVDTFGLQFHALRAHYRIGHKIARVADRLIPPENGAESLEDASNYNLSLGEPSASLIECDDRDAQFDKMLENLLLERDAFGGDSIGVICGRSDTCKELRERFDGTVLSDFVWVHGVDDGANFSDDKFIHVLTMHSSKGTEYRSVHMFGVEEINGTPLQRTRIIYTAVTRAKTALKAYTTGQTTRALENAFSEPRCPNLDDILPVSI